MFVALNVLNVIIWAPALLVVMAGIGVILLFGVSFAAVRFT